jgi:hypothetical protein
VRKGDRVLVWIINLLLAAAFVSAILVFAEQIHKSGWPWFSRVAACWPTVVCFVAGLIVGVRKLRGKVPICIASMVVAGAVMFLTFPARDIGHICFMALADLLGIYLFFIGSRGDEPYPPSMAIISVVLLLVEGMAFSNIDKEVTNDIGALPIVTLATFLLSMFSFNAAGISSGLHNTKSGQNMRVPTGLRGKNMLLLALVLIVGIALSFVKPLHSVFSYILVGILFVISKISDLMNSGQSTPEPTNTPEPTEYSIEPTTLPDIPTSRPLQIGFYVFMGIVLVLGAIILFAIFFGGSENSGRGRGGGRRRLLKLKKKVEDEEYDDDVERLHDLQSLLRERRAKAALRLKKLLRRPQKIDDMPDGRTKIRFAYYSLLRSASGREMSRALTPMEVSGRQRREELRRLAADYSAVRYDELYEPDADGAKNAARAMSVMRRR